MKLERISENQIRCTLNRSDLLSRQIKLSELAYGSGKTRELFRDMMTQAYTELGFEADDIPLMIEAIPVSSECIVLIITKVDNPDDLDDKFAKFLPEEDDNDDDNDNLFSGLDFSDIEDVSDDSPAIKSKESENGGILSRVYSFDSLTKVIHVSKLLPEKCNLENSLYKSPDNGKYYLVIFSTEENRGAYYKLANILSEFGESEPALYASGNYFMEHYNHILIHEALQQLSLL